MVKAYAHSRIWKPPAAHPHAYGGKFMRRRRSCKQGSERGDYFSFAYSALASLRMGMSGSASFQRPRN
jgi:hypothetical protein